MKILASTIVATLMLTACGTSATNALTVSPGGRVSASPTITAPPSEQPVTTKLVCGSPPSTGHPLLLLQPGGYEPVLAVLDVSDPLKPQQLCKLSPANGGRFISATKIAFWAGQQIGLADLMSGVVSVTGELAAATGAAFSPDGSAYLYRAGDDTLGSPGTSVHINDRGTDRVLSTQGPIGGHGGPPYGPREQLEFSPDGRYILNFSVFRPIPGPPNFLVFGRDGSLAFQSTTAAFGVWAPSGSKLYFLAQNGPGGIGGDIHSWDPSGGEVTVAKGLSGYFWPAIAPDGATLAFDAYDSSVPGGATGGLPHLWRLDLSTGTVAQISTAVSQQNLFVSATVVWSDEERLCECGPGGSSAPTGRVLSHNLSTGRDTVVDLGPPTQSSSINQVRDVWIR